MRCSSASLYPDRKRTLTVHRLFSPTVILVVNILLFFFCLKNNIGWESQPVCCACSFFSFCQVPLTEQQSALEVFPAPKLTAFVRNNVVGSSKCSSRTGLWSSTMFCFLSIAWQLSEVSGSNYWIFPSTWLVGWAKSVWQQDITLSGGCFLFA